MFKNSWYSLVKSSAQLSLGIMSVVAALFVGFHAKPSLSNVVMYNSNTSDVMLLQEDKYYVPYVKTENSSVIAGESKFVRAFDRYINIYNSEGFDVLENGKLVAHSENGSWFISIPANDNVLVITADNMKAIQDDRMSSNVNSFVNYVVGQRNGIWFKKMKVFIPIDADIHMISSRINEGAHKMSFMSDREKYFCLKINAKEIDMSGASIESISLLKSLGILGKRAKFYNIYSGMTSYLDFFIKSYGVFYGSLLVMIIMLIICSYDVFMRVRRNEINQNKSIEIDIAQKQFANDPVKLQETLLSINNNYSQKDTGLLTKSIVFLLFEAYVQFAVVNDYCGVRGMMLGNNDLGMSEIVNLSNLFGLLPNNAWIAIGPLTLVSAFILNSSFVNQLSTGQEQLPMKSIQFVFFVYMLFSKSVFFILFYLTYNVLKSMLTLVVLKIRSSSSVKIVG